MGRIEEDIKNGKYARIYLIHGTQAYLRSYYKKMLKKALVSPGDEMNYSYFEGEDISVGEVIDIAETMPFLGQYRVIILENTGLFNCSCDQLADYLQDVPDTTIMIFSEEKVDNRLKQTKAVKNYGAVVEFSEKSREEIKNWVTNRLNKEHRKITYDALDKFVDNCGTDMMTISTELEKLISYTFGRDGIRVEDIDAICTVQIEDKVFLMMDAMFRGNTGEALALYGDLLALHQEPFAIMKLIESQLRLLLHVKQLNDERKTTKEMAQILGMNEFRIKKSLPQSKKSSKIWIIEGLNYCADVEKASKQGGINRQIGLETIICRLSKADCN